MEREGERSSSSRSWRPATKQPAATTTDFFSTSSLPGARQRRPRSAAHRRRGGGRRRCSPRGRAEPGDHGTRPLLGCPLSLFFLQQAAGTREDLFIHRHILDWQKHVQPPFFASPVPLSLSVYPWTRMWTARYLSAR